MSDMNVFSRIISQPNHSDKTILSENDTRERQCHAGYMIEFSL